MWMFSTSCNCGEWHVWVTQRDLGVVGDLACNPLSVATVKDERGRDKSVLKY